MSVNYDYRKSREDQVAKTFLIRISHMTLERRGQLLRVGAGGASAAMRSPAAATSSAGASLAVDKLRPKRCEGAPHGAERNHLVI